MFPILAILGAVGLLAYFSTKSTKSAQGTKNDSKNEPLSKATAEKILSVKQQLPEGTKLPDVTRAPDGELIFSTKQGGPSRSDRQANQRFPFAFAPVLVGSSAKQFAKDFTGSEANYVELVGMPVLVRTSSKQHPSGIWENTFSPVGIISPTEDGDGWVLLRKGATAPEMWSPPDPSSADALMITVPPAWRTGISERRNTAWDRPGFEIDAGLAPVFVA